MREKPGLKVRLFIFILNNVNMLFVARLLDVTKLHSKILMRSKETKKSYVFQRTVS